MDRIANAVTGGDLAPSEAAALAKVVEIHLLAVQAHSTDARLTGLEAEARPHPRAAI